MTLQLGNILCAEHPKGMCMRYIAMELALLALLFRSASPTQCGPRSRIDGLLYLEIQVPLEIQWWYNRNSDNPSNPTESWALAHVYGSPSRDSHPIGEITIEAVWVEDRLLDLVLGYRPAEADSVSVWRGRLGDWGYGIHQAVLQSRGDWVMLPPGPYGDLGWVRLQTDAGGDGLPGRLVSLEGRLIEIDSMSALNMRTGDSTCIGRRVYYVTAADSEVVELRPELPSDMPGGASEGWGELEADSLPLYRVPLGSMLDEDGQPRFEVAYPRGS